MADLAAYAWGLTLDGRGAINGTIDLTGPGDIFGLAVAEVVEAVGTLEINADQAIGAFAYWPHPGNPILAAFPNIAYGVRAGRSAADFGGFFPTGSGDSSWAFNPLTPGTLALNEMEDLDSGSAPAFDGAVSGFNYSLDALSWTNSDPTTDAAFRLVRTFCYTLLVGVAQLDPARAGSEVEFTLRWELDASYGPAAGVPGSAPEITAGGFPAGSGAVPQLVQSPTGGAPGRVFNKAELMTLAAAHGAPDPNLAAAVALAESGGREDAANTANTDGSRDDGLWQINSIHGYSIEFLHDADNNAEAMMAVSGGGVDFTPWVTYNSGAYLDFL